MSKINDKVVALQPGDIFFTKGASLLSKCIRFCTRSIGEGRTQVNHVGIVIDTGTLHTASIIEAVHNVCVHDLYYQYGPPIKDLIAVYRPLNLTKEEIDTVVATAKKQVGKNYGYIKLVAHFLDWLCFGMYAFRRLVPGDKYPICSWLVAHSFSSVGKHFGVEPGQAEPDDIWDFITHYWSSKFRNIRPLDKL